MIGKPCYQAPREGIDDIIFGYTCVNDVTAPNRCSQMASSTSGVAPRAFPVLARSVR